MMEAAKDTGIREVLLLSYFDLQALGSAAAGAGAQAGSPSAALSSPTPRLHVAPSSASSSIATQIIRPAQYGHDSPVGLVHLKISFRESKSDDRRFYIITRAKTMQLRTNSANERAAWIEALVSARADGGLLSNQNDASFSTERLRNHMHEEGLGEEIIEDCEQIVHSEFSQYHTQMKQHCEEYVSFLSRLPQQLELQRTSSDQIRRIQKTEHALKAVEEELMKVQLETTTKVKQLREVHGAWLPPWLATHAPWFPSEVAEMEVRLQQLNNGIPTRAMLQTLANKFSASHSHGVETDGGDPAEAIPAGVPPCEGPRNPSSSQAATATASSSGSSSAPSKFISVGMYMIPFASLLAPAALADGSRSMEKTVDKLIYDGKAYDIVDIPQSKGGSCHLEVASSCKSIACYPIMGSTCFVTSIYYITQIDATPMQSALIWVVLSIIVLISLSILFGPPYSAGVEWKLLKATMITSISIGLGLMSIVNFATVQLGALIEIPMCLFSRPLKASRMNLLPQVVLLASNIVFVVMGFPPAAMLIMKGLFKGPWSSIIDVGDFWVWMETWSSCGNRAARCMCIYFLSIFPPGF